MRPLHVRRHDLLTASNSIKKSFKAVGLSANDCHVSVASMAYTAEDNVKEDIRGLTFHYDFLNFGLLSSNKACGWQSVTRQNRWSGIYVDARTQPAVFRQEHRILNDAASKILKHGCMQDIDTYTRDIETYISSLRHNSDQGMRLHDPHYQTLASRAPRSRDLSEMQVRR